MKILGHGNLCTQWRGAVDSIEVLQKWEPQRDIPLQESNIASQRPISMQTNMGEISHSTS